MAKIELPITVYSLSENVMLTEKQLEPVTVPMHIYTRKDKKAISKFREITDLSAVLNRKG